MSDGMSVKTINRLVNVLDCFSTEHPAWSLAELSEHLTLPKSTLHRFLTGLEACGLLYRDPGDRRWRLGYRLVGWGALAAAGSGLRALAQPALRELAALTGETAILTVYENQEVVCLDKVETSHPVRLTLEVGARRPAHAGASSKIILAHLPDDEIQAIFHARGLLKLCVNTLTEPEALLAELAQIRAQGYATSFEETDLGVMGIAAPAFAPGGRLVAGIGIAAPLSRAPEARVPELAPLVIHAAQILSQRLRVGAA